MKKLLLICILTLLFTPKSKAQILDGGEIYYELISPSYYKITAHVYRQCEFDPLQSLSGFVAYDTLRENITYTRTSIKKLNDTCGNPCNKTNNYSNPGIEKHTFIAFVNFNDVRYKRFVTAGACFVHFAVRQGGRDNRTTTHGTGMFYMDAGVNICDTNIKNNHSPIFSMDPKFIAPANQPLWYSPGPLDSSDYDSLAFSIEPVQTNFNQNISYSQNYSGTIPITPYCPPTPGYTGCAPLPNANPPRGFYFDKLNCQMIFTPSINTDMGYIKFKIREYRKINNQMVLLGFTTREMKFTPNSTLNNTPPRFTPDVKTTFTLCSNGLKVNVVTSDANSGDNTYINWDKGYNSATLTVDSTDREQTAIIDLFYDSTMDNKWNYFTIAVRDVQCNSNLNTNTLLVKNLPKAEYIKNYTIDSCNRFSFSVKDKNNQFGYNTTALIYNENNIQIGSINNFVKFTFNKNGKYFIDYTIKTLSGCNVKAYDTITISNAFLSANINYPSDTIVCSSFEAKFKFNPYLNPRIKSIEWYKNDTLLNTGDSSVNSTIYGQSTFKLKLIAQNNCLAENTMLFRIRKYNINLIHDPSDFLCINTTNTTTAGGSILQKQPVQYRWKIDKIDSTTSNNSFTYPVKRDTKLYLFATDDNHCTVIDSINISTIDPITFKLKKSDFSVCQDSLATFTIDSLNSNPSEIEWIHAGLDTTTNKLLTYSRIINSNSKIYVKIKDAFLCEANDSISISTIPNPQPYITGQTEICHYNTAVISAGANNRSSQFDFKWLKNGVGINSIDTFQIYSDSGNTIYRFQVANDGKCYAEVSHTIGKFPITQVQIVSDTNYNHFNRIQLSTNSSFNSYLWNNGTQTRNNDFWAYDLGVPGKYIVFCKVVDANGCESADTLDIYTDKQLSISNEKIKTIKTYPNPVESKLYVETDDQTSYTIFSSEGKLVMSGSIESSLTAIDVKNLSSGVYFLVMGNQRIPFVVE